LAPFLEIHTYIHIDTFILEFGFRLNLEEKQIQLSLNSRLKRERNFLKVCGNNNEHLGKNEMDLLTALI
jgi:hypothetical protein